MKKLFYLFIIVGLGIVSCNKPSDTATLQDVIFKATEASTNTFKDGQPADCENPMAQYALIDIDGISYFVDVFYLGGVIYTNTLKLAPGLHTVNTFTLMNEQGTPLDTSDDVKVQATPLLGSEYEKFVKMPLPFEFTVDAFFKLEVNIEILCFVPNDYVKFGFAWYTAEEVIVRKVCFFGDVCAEDYLDYGQSLYAQQKYGLQHDMPAIFKIEVWRTTNELSDSITTYGNEDWLGEGAPLCVQYPDFKDVEDLIEFKLFILLKVGDGFEYVHTYTFSTLDGMPLDNIGEDNIMDFALGTCVQNPDVVIPFDLNKMVIIPDPDPDPDPDPNPLIGEETAFAFDSNGLALCFIEDPDGPNGNSWGWTNGPYAEGDYTLELWAGAGQCDQSKGYNVGTVDLSYHNGTVNVTYTVNEGIELQVTHLYVGSEKYPLKNGKPTVAPGSYPYKYDPLPAGTSSYTFDLTYIFSSDLYIIAHAEGGVESKN